MNDPRTVIRAKALELGFDAVGFGPASLGLEARKRLRDFLSNGYHGEMSWLANRVDERSQPFDLWPEARSVISLGLNYAQAENALRNLSQRDVGNISIYARNRDYHVYFKGMLKHLAQAIAKTFGASLKVFVDTAPVMERPLAAQSGLGWIGKHTNLVSRKFGSWLFLGEIYTNLEISHDVPHQSFCGSCSRCMDACPTNAFTNAYQLNATRCISYLTIEHKGPIPLELRESIGNRIYGCDDCLAVCPWNRFAKVSSPHPKLLGREDLLAPDLGFLVALGDEGFRHLFAASPMKRIGWLQFLRNVLTAIGNSHNAALLGAIRLNKRHDNAVVAEAAHWAECKLSVFLR